MILIIFMLLFLVLFILTTSLLLYNHDYWQKRYAKLEMDYTSTKTTLYDIKYDVDKASYSPVGTDLKPTIRLTVSRIAKLFKAGII